MTDQLRQALDQLNACATADDVAMLLRRHGIKGGDWLKSDRCITCPVAVYLQTVGGVPGAIAHSDRAIIDGNAYPFTHAVREFVHGADRGAFEDLEAEAAI